MSKLQLEHSLDCPEVRNISTSAMRLQATEVLSTVPNQPSEGIFDNAFLCPWTDEECVSIIAGPMLIVDACHIKSKYGGVIMAASVHDETIPEIKQPEAVIVHDWEKGLQQTQKQALRIFVRVHMCLAPRKKRNTIFKSKFGGQIWAAAKAAVKSSTMKR
ncbi:hypothetical protein BASA83_006536 [Batrachochytrium salamandrivorans]|nr:hypothetical protein BASA83_006536 [Batrachochytrium salamandrivorans]